MPTRLTRITSWEDVQQLDENYQEDVESVKFPDKLDDIQKILDKFEDTEGKNISKNLQNS